MATETLSEREKKSLSNARHVSLVICNNGAVPHMSCQGQAGKVTNKQLLKRIHFSLKGTFVLFRELTECGKNASKSNL